MAAGCHGAATDPAKALDPTRPRRWPSRIGHRRIDEQAECGIHVGVDTAGQLNALPAAAKQQTMSAINPAYG
jgi:hypothetical protein